MISYDDLKNDVCGQLKISPTSNDLTRFQVLASLNMAQRHILSTLPARMINTAVKTVKRDISSGVYLYQYPSDMLRILRMWLDYTSEISATNPGQSARIEIDPNRMRSFYTKPTMDYPIVSLEVEDGYQIAPVPVGDVTNGQRIQYVQQMPEISAAQASMLPDSLRNLLTFYATSIAANVEGSYPELASGAMTLYENELQRLIPKYEAH